MIVHDLFAQDDVAMEDALYVKSTIGLCAMLQNVCNKEKEYDVCMESLATRVGDFEQELMNNEGCFPEGANIWFGKDQASKLLDWSTNLDHFACLCAILWKPAFTEARRGDKLYCREHALI